MKVLLLLRLMDEASRYMYIRVLKTADAQNLSVGGGAGAAMLDAKALCTSCVLLVRLGRALPASR
jgi:hypothetical protein